MEHQISMNNDKVIDITIEELEHATDAVSTNTQDAKLFHFALPGGRLSRDTTAWSEFVGQIQTVATKGDTVSGRTLFAGTALAALWMSDAAHVALVKIPDAKGPYKQGYSQCDIEGCFSGDTRTTLTDYLDVSETLAEFIEWGTERLSENAGFEAGECDSPKRRYYENLYSDGVHYDSASSLYLYGLWVASWQKDTSDRATELSGALILAGIPQSEINEKLERLLLKSLAA